MISLTVTAHLGWVLCVELPDGLFYRLAYDIWGESGLGEGGQADHPFDRFIVFATGAQQVEESSQKNDLQKYDEQHNLSRLFTLSNSLFYARTTFTHKSTPKHVQQRSWLSHTDVSSRGLQRFFCIFLICKWELRLIKNWPNICCMMVTMLDLPPNTTAKTEHIKGF